MPTLNRINLPGDDTTIRYVSDDATPLLNRIEVKIIDINGNTLGTEILDYNLRLGFDASTQILLDTPDLAVPYIDPTI